MYIIYTKFFLSCFSGVARYTDCKMFIRFAISDDGMKLVVNGKLETHCHDEVNSLTILKWNYFYLKCQFVNFIVVP